MWTSFRLSLPFSQCLRSIRSTYVDGSFQGETQLLNPVSLDLEIQRNLSSNWYHSIPDIMITAHLKPMIVSGAEVTVAVSIEKINK